MQRKRVKWTRSGKTRRSLADGTMAENYWAKSTKDEGNRARKMIKVADLHKTRGYPRPLFSPSRTKRTFGDAVMLWRESDGAMYIMDQKYPHEEQIAVTFNDRNVQGWEKIRTFNGPQFLKSTYNLWPYLTYILP